MIPIDFEEFYNENELSEEFEEEIISEIQVDFSLFLFDKEGKKSFHSHT